jgi:hypothetical protein
VPRAAGQGRVWSELPPTTFERNKLIMPLKTILSRRVDRNQELYTISPFALSAANQQQNLA